MITHIKKIKVAVKQILLDHPKTRDNDNLLVLKVWALQKPNLRDISFLDFAKDFVNLSYASPGAIGRTRRSLQEKHSELRGSLWYKRKKQAEQTRIEIRNL